MISYFFGVYIVWRKADLAKLGSPIPGLSTRFYPFLQDVQHQAQQRKINQSPIYNKSMGQMWRTSTMKIWLKLKKIIDGLDVLLV